MIAALFGKIYSIDEKEMIFCVNNVFYEIIINKRIFDFLKNRGKTNDFLVSVTAIYSETKRKLFGHVDFEEKKLFAELMKVERIGASMANKILSQVSREQLKNIIINSDQKLLLSINGVGQNAAIKILETLTKNKVFTK